MPDRWERCRTIFEGLDFPAQLVTYEATGHELKPEMIEDLIAFFRANQGKEPARIEPHAYPAPPPGTSGSPRDPGDR